MDEQHPDKHCDTCTCYRHDKDVWHKEPEGGRRYCSVGGCGNRPVAVRQTGVKHRKFHLCLLHSLRQGIRSGWDGTLEDGTVFEQYVRWKRSDLAQFGLSRQARDDLRLHGVTSTEQLLGQSSMHDLLWKSGVKRHQRQIVEQLAKLDQPT